jgi:hypothetical protein
MPDRPLQDAAEEVRQLAIDARGMLAQIKQSWLWALLCRQPAANYHGPNVQPPAPDAS